MALTKTEIQTLIDGILSGLFTIEQLPRNLFVQIFKDLEKALVRGMNIPRIQKTAPKEQLTAFLQISRNLRRFSAAKTYQVIKNVGSLTDLADMLEKFKLYMDTYQKVEQDLVLKQGQTVQDWFVFDDQKDVFPFLRYVTANDERVRHEHAALNGIIKPVSDSFWDEFLPLNGYRCRCTVEQLERAVSSKILPTEMQRLKQGVTLQFRNNPAKTGFVFKETGKDKHPYFKIPEKDKKNVNKLIK